MLRPLKVTVKNCKDVDPKTLWKEVKANDGPYSAVLFITSTFGEGSPPTSAEKFFDELSKLPASALSGVPYSVMAIGSMIYPVSTRTTIQILVNCKRRNIFCLYYYLSCCRLTHLLRLFSPIRPTGLLPSWHQP
jgi:hypothetical protein